MVFFEKMLNDRYNSRAPGNAISWLKTYVLITSINGTVGTVDLIQALFLGNFPTFSRSVPLKVNLAKLVQISVPMIACSCAAIGWNYIKVQRSYMARYAHEQMTPPPLHPHLAWPPVALPPLEVLGHMQLQVRRFQHEHGFAFDDHGRKCYLDPEELKMEKDMIEKMGEDNAKLMLMQNQMAEDTRQRGMLVGKLGPIGQKGVYGRKGGRKGMAGLNSLESAQGGMVVPSRGKARKGAIKGKGSPSSVVHLGKGAGPLLKGGPTGNLRSTIGQTKTKGRTKKTSDDQAGSNCSTATSSPVDEKNSLAPTTQTN